MTHLPWGRSLDGLVAQLGPDRWRARWVRAGDGGRRWWLYLNGARYTPTGDCRDAVSFRTARECTRYAEGIAGGIAGGIPEAS